MTSATQGPDIVEQLRHEVLDNELGRKITKGVDEITRLRAEVEQLTSAKDAAIRLWNDAGEELARKDAVLRELVAAHDNLAASRRVPFNEKAVNMRSAQDRHQAAWAAARAEVGKEKA